MTIVCRTSSVLIVVIFMSVTLSSTGHKITDTQIKHLCSKTHNFNGCYKLLKSDYHSVHVDLQGLAGLSIDLALKVGNKSNSYLNSLAEETHDSQLRNVYGLCSDNYNDAIHDLEVAKENLNTGSYSKMPVQIKDAFKETESCNDLLETSTDPADIKKKNRHFQFLISIVMVISINLNKN
ncbi:hypothetical protein ACP275_13G196400 [Erythranthe tilingii]